VKIWLIKGFEFYVKSNIHLAFSVTCLGGLSLVVSQDKVSENVLIFIFSSALFSYNFIKFSTLFHNSQKDKIPKSILFISLVSFVIALGMLFTFSFIMKGFALIGSILVVLYSISFDGFSNWRNKKGLKIYLVALSWILLTVGIPLASDSFFSISLFLKLSFIQFVYVWVAILPFEIRDVTIDSSHLKTLPQQLGIYKTKILGIILLVLGASCSLLFFGANNEMLFSTLLIFVLLGMFLYYSDPSNSFYYTAFWVEGIPVVWLGSYFLFLYF
jgi:4-hydroxybenzoate polyprenyltransferase